MFKAKTDAKPAVLDWLNPNNTIHNNTGRVFGLGLQPNPNPKTRNVLVALCDKQVFLSLLLSLPTFVFAPKKSSFPIARSIVFNMFSTMFSTIEEFSTKDGDSLALAKLYQQGQKAALHVLRQASPA